MSTPTDFVLVSNWQIAAPRERVWQALKHPLQWPSLRSSQQGRSFDHRR